MNKFNKSKNIIKITIFLSFIILSLVIFLVFDSLILDRKYNNKINTEITNREINISEYRIKTVFDKNFKNRIIKKLDKSVFIGETGKQIENGYYDIKTYIQNNKCIVICLNKLWKMFDERLYEEEYITEMAESIKEILDINVPLNEIYDYIISGYTSAKNISNSSKDNKGYILYLDDFVIKGSVLEKEFVMSIYKMSKKGSGKCE